MEDKYKKYKLKYLNLKIMVGGGKIDIHFNNKGLIISLSVNINETFSETKQRICTHLNISADSSIKFIRKGKQLKENLRYENYNLNNNETINITII